MNNKKQKNIPDGWIIKQIQEFAKTSSGGTPKSTEKNFYVGGDIPWLKSGEVRKGKIFNFNNFITKSGLENSSAKIFPKNTVLIAMYGITAGQIGILKSEASTNQALCGVLPNTYFSSDYLFYFLKTKTNNLLKMGIGAAQPNISQETLKNYDILLPPILEQNLIVEVLETWDEYLEKLNKKIKIKRNIKKGLMQKLLNGKKRLKGFVGEWKKIKLEDVGKIITGNTPPMKDKDNYGNEYCWATAEDFNDKYIKNTNIKLSEKGKSLSRFLPKGSILVTCIASIGKNAIADVPLATNQQINSIIVNKKNNNEFIYYFIQNSINLLRRYAGAGAMPILNKVTFSKIKIKIPNIEEQKVIAETLTESDKEIEKLEKKMKIIENQKKYLLNNLITGKIRVPEFSK